MKFCTTVADTQELANKCNAVDVADLIPPGIEWSTFKSQAMVDGPYVLGYLYRDKLRGFVQVTLQHEYRGREKDLPQIVRMKIEAMVKGLMWQA